MVFIIWGDNRELHDCLLAKEEELTVFFMLHDIGLLIVAVEPLV